MRNPPVSTRTRQISEKNSSFLRIRTIARLVAESTEYSLLSDWIFSAVRWFSTAVRILWVSSANWLLGSPPFWI